MCICFIHSGCRRSSEVASDSQDFAVTLYDVSYVNMVLAPHLQLVAMRLHTAAVILGVFIVWKTQSQEIVLPSNNSG